MNLNDKQTRSGPGKCGTAGKVGGATTAFGLACLLTLASASATETNPLAWKALVLVYRNVDVNYTNSEGTWSYLGYSMSPADYELFLDTIARVPDTIANWSASRADVQLTVMTVDEPIRSLNANGEPNEYLAPSHALYPMRPMEADGEDS